MRTLLLALTIPAIPATQSLYAQTKTSAETKIYRVSDRLDVPVREVPAEEKIPSQPETAKAATGLNEIQEPVKLVEPSETEAQPQKAKTDLLRKDD